MKKVFKFLKIILYFILFVLVVLFVTPFIFKGKIIKIANEQLSNNLNAEASFSDLNLSLFTNFPYLGVKVKNVLVVGIDEFENDTLASIEYFDAAVNLFSVIKMENIEVRKIHIEKPRLNAIVLEDGLANWDIAIESEETEEVADTTEGEFNANIALKSFTISQADLSYTDLSSDLSATLENLNFSLSGDMSLDEAVLLLETNIEKINLYMSGVRYLTNTELDLHIDIDANMKESIYKLNQNSLTLNDLTLMLDGQVEMPNEEQILVDMNYATSKTDFKSLLSLVPAIYMRDFEGLETSGKLALNGDIKGVVQGEETPNITGKLVVENAMFNYPSMPKSAENINIDIDYFVDGKQQDNTTVDVNKFHLELGGNPIDLSLNLRTPISDPFTNGHLHADLDLKTLTDIIPLEDMEIKGVVKTNLDWMGNVSTLENEQYEDFKADGSIIIKDFVYNSPDLPKSFSIFSSEIYFSPKYLDIAKFVANIGSSNFGFDGKVKNFVPYALSDGILWGELNFSGGTIDLNEFMTSSEETPEEETEEADTSALEVFEVPKNLDLTLTSRINKLYYDKLEIDNLVGIIKIKEGKVLMEKLKMNALDGTLALTGEYNTQDIKSPLVDMNIDASGIDIPMAFASFGILEKIAPIASRATGKVSLGLDFSSFLKNNMTPVLESMIGGGSLGSKTIGIKGGTAFSAIGNQLNSDAFENLTLNDLNLDYEIRGGKVLVNPFETKMGNTNFLISGEQSFDRTMNYGINIAMPRSILGSANTAVNDLYANAASKGINIPKSDMINILAKVTGDIARPKVELDLKNTAKQTTQEIKKELEATAKKAIEEKKTEAKAEAKAEADKILKQAEREAEEIKKQAKIAADKVRKEADINAERLLKEAKNPIAKAAAEPAAKKIRQEGEKNATKIEDEADQKAKQVLENAQKKSDMLLK